MAINSYAGPNSAILEVASGMMPSREGQGAMDVDVDGPGLDPVETPAEPAAPPTPLAPTASPPAADPVGTAPSDAVAAGPGIDVVFEASKLPLDVAIFNSARAAGGDEKIRKYLQAVLVLGGGSLVPGMAHALESR